MVPVDVIVAKDNKSKGQQKSLDKINDNDVILDIGEKTSNKISEIIIEPVSEDKFENKISEIKENTTPEVKNESETNFTEVSFEDLGKK